MAIDIGGENRFGRVTVEALERYIKVNGKKTASAIASARIDSESACELMCQLARETPHQLRIALREDVPGMSELHDRLLEPVCQNCVQALNTLGVAL